MKLILFTFLSSLLFCNNGNLNVSENGATNTIVSENKVSKYQSQIKHIKTFSKTNGYNQNVAIMIDYSLHSGKNRFFIVDLKNEKIKKRALVCHGSCKGDNYSDMATTFSNEANSYCTTLGMALIGERAYSTWGSNY